MPTVEFHDAFIGQHFGHHDRFRQRQPGRRWRFEQVRVPSPELRCLYPDPGVSPENPSGLMGSVGLPATPYQGEAIQAMAGAIERALAANTADTHNAALRKVLAFRDGGVALIQSVSQPFALSRLANTWYVREGTHRAIALALLHEPSIEGIDFESAVLL